MTNRDLITGNRERKPASSRRGLSLALTLLVALALITTAAFAYSGGDAIDAAEYEVTGEDVNLAGLHARNFTELLDRETDQAAVAESNQELAGVFARSFTGLLDREADQAAVAESNQELAGVFARSFTGLLDREADQATVAESNQELAGVFARSFSELLEREAEETLIKLTAKVREECTISC